MRRTVKSPKRSEHARELIREIAAVLTYIFCCCARVYPIDEMKHGSPFPQTTPRAGDGGFQGAVDEMKEAAN